MEVTKGHVNADFTEAYDICPSVTVHVGRSRRSALWRCASWICSRNVALC
jgi:hypothetical protein